MSRGAARRREPRPEEETMPSRILRLLAVVGCAAALCAGATARADETVELRFSHFVPANFIIFKKGGGFAAWADSIEKESGGTIKIKFFPAGQLGNARDHYNLVVRGIADMALVNPGYTAGRFPIISLAEMPFAFSDTVQAAAALTDWYRAYAGKEMPEVRVLNVFVNPAAMLHTTKPVMGPQDVKGLKLRPGNATMAKFVKLLGGSSVQVTIVDSRDALARHMVDGTFLSFNSIVKWGQNKLVQYHLDVPLFYANFVTAMNKAKYESLSPAQKKVIDDHSTPQWAQRIIEPWEEEDKGGLERMLKDGNEHHVHKPTAAELAAWHDATKPMLAAWGKEVRERTGLDPDQIRAALAASLKKY